MLRMRSKVYGGLLVCFLFYFLCYVYWLYLLDDCRAIATKGFKGVYAVWQDKAVLAIFNYLEKLVWLFIFVFASGKKRLRVYIALVQLLALV